MHQHKMLIGMRTVKSAIAILVALIIVEQYGASTSKVIFALIGAASAMDITFKASLKSCLAQICGVFFGALFGLLMLYLPIDRYIAVAIGFILVMTLYNMLHLHLSPVLPCIVIAMVLTNPEIEPISYALGRLWDTTIGLGVGLLINVVFFPYDTRRQMRETVDELDRDLLQFLEDYFDGDEKLPDPERMAAKIAGLERQLNLMSEQKWVIHRRKKKLDLCSLRKCDVAAKQLVTELEALSLIDIPGRLTEENRERLQNCGAVIRDQRIAEPCDVMDTVTNYHVERVLALRRAIREELGKP